jgi:hypothetical protein
VRELSALEGAVTAVDLVLARRSIPKRAAAFANLQINKNVHSLYLMCACARAGRLLCALPAGLRELTVARVGSGGTTAYCGLPAFPLRPQNARVLDGQIRSGREAPPRELSSVKDCLRL